MQQQSLVQEAITIDPRAYFVKRPKDAKKAADRVGVRYRNELVNQLIKARFAFNVM